MGALFTVRISSPGNTGKKLAIFGDTAPCPAALQLAQGVDMMVHEATLETPWRKKPTAVGTAQRIRRRSWRGTQAWETRHHPRQFRYDAGEVSSYWHECRQCLRKPARKRFLYQVM
jgi:ribonuclease Z